MRASQAVVVGTAVVLGLVVVVPRLGVALPLPQMQKVVVLLVLHLVEMVVTGMAAPQRTIHPQLEMLLDGRTVVARVVTAAVAAAVAIMVVVVVITAAAAAAVVHMLILM